MGLPRKVLPTRAKTLQPQNRREKKARRCTHSCQNEFPPNMRPFLLKPVGKKSSGARVSEKIYPKRRFFVKFLATRKSIFFACLSVLPACLSPGGRGRFGRRTGRVKGPPLGVRAFGPCRKADETSPLPDFPLHPTELPHAQPKTPFSLKNPLTPNTVSHPDPLPRRGEGSYRA